MGRIQVAVLATGREAPQYLDALRFQMSIAQAVANAQGYQGEHFRLIDAATPDDLGRRCGTGRSRCRRAWPRRSRRRATSGRRWRFAFEHLAQHAPVPRTTIPLPAGAPFGTLDVDATRCTMCLACVGSCPEAALLDHAESPQLRFIETNCVQCGICANTCPEQAITLCRGSSCRRSRARRAC